VLPRVQSRNQANHYVSSRQVTKKLLGFGTSHPVDSSIDVFFYANDSCHAYASHSATDLTPGSEDTLLAPQSDRPTRIRSPPAHFEDYVAHVSTVPRVYVTNACSTDLTDHVEEIVVIPDLSIMVAHPRHKSTEGPVSDVALVSANVCVEPASYKEALISP
jgi:hypothetical protein